MNFMQFCHQKGNFSTLNLRFAYFGRSKMSIKGITMFLGMNNKRLERKILIILDFENGFLPTYLPLWSRETNLMLHGIFFHLGVVHCKRSTHLAEYGNVTKQTCLFEKDVYNFSKNRQTREFPD